MQVVTLATLGVSLASAFTPGQTAEGFGDEK